MNLIQFSFMTLSLLMLGCSDPKVNTETSNTFQSYDGVDAQTVFGTVAYHEGNFT